MRDASWHNDFLRLPETHAIRLYNVASTAIDQHWSSVILKAISSHRSKDVMWYSLQLLPWRYQSQSTASNERVDWEIVIYHNGWTEESVFSTKITAVGITYNTGRQKCVVQFTNRQKEWEKYPATRITQNSSSVTYMKENIGPSQGTQIRCVFASCCLQILTATTSQELSPWL